jgi:hypothetical protein
MIVKTSKMANAILVTKMKRKKIMSQGDQTDQNKTFLENFLKRNLTKK